MKATALSARLIVWAHEGPMFERASLGRRILPFMLGSVAVVVPMTLLPPTDLGVFLIGLALSGLCAAMAMLVPWRRLPKIAEVAAPVVGIVAIAFLRDGSGGSSSGYSVLMLLPVLWVALYGSARQIGIMVAALFIALVIPLIAIGGPGYPAAEWRRVLVIVTVGAMLGWIVNSLVGAVRREALAAGETARRLENQTLITQQVVETASDAVLTVDDQGRILDVNPAAVRLVGRPATELVGSSAMEVMLTPERAARARVALLELVSAERAPFGLEAEIVRPDRTTVPVEAWLSASGEPTARRVHVFARDITDRRRAETRAKEHLVDLDRILMAARSLSNSMDPAESRQMICATARTIAGADVAFYFERDAASSLVIRTGSTVDLPVDLGATPARSFVGASFDSHEASFAPNLATDPRRDLALARKVGMVAAYWQPVVNGDVVVGVLVLGWTAPDPVMDGRARSLIEVLSTQVAGTLARAQLVEQLQDMARTDSLTGLLNRRAMTEALDRDIAGARRLLRPMSIAMLDLDHFKAFNDRFGHQAGDRLLVDAARRWTAELRPMDTLARYGGEEFLILLPGCDARMATTIADRLRAAVPEHQTCSVGVAQWNGIEAATSLIERADDALYRAKESGRDATVTADGGANPADAAVKRRRRTGPNTAPAST